MLTPGTPVRIVLDERNKNFPDADNRTSYDRQNGEIVQAFTNGHFSESYDVKFGEGVLRVPSCFVFANPVAGGPATVGIGSDTYADKVVRVSDSGKTVWLEKHRGPFRLNKRGFFRDSSYVASFAAATDYRDPSF